MRRVLFISPHFPPDSSAGTHRARLLAPHLEAHGWSPTLLTVETAAIDARLDQALLALVPATLRVVRAPAWQAKSTRRVGFGDLGLRAYTGLRRTALALLRHEPFDAIAITIYPAWTALLARPLKAQSGLPVVLDYQDPWVGAWGAQVGPGRDGRPDWRSRMSRAIAQVAEPYALAAVDGLMAVSAGTRDGIVARHPAVGALPFAEVPIGGDPADMQALDGAGVVNHWFDPSDGLVHLVHAGTVLPMAMDTWDALLAALAALRQRDPALGARVRLHAIGTANTTDVTAPPRVMPRAERAGVADLVREVPWRLDYLDALRVQRDASALLVVGSRESHYTASKLYPALLAQRPVLAIVHEASSVATLLRETLRAPSGQVLTFGPARPLTALHDALTTLLLGVVRHPIWSADDVDPRALDAYGAFAMAGRMADLLSRVASAQGRH